MKNAFSMIIFPLNAILIISLLLTVCGSYVLYAFGNIPISIPKDASNPSSSDYFLPPVLTIQPKTTVTWTNYDETIHTVTEGSNNISDLVPKFDSGMIGINKSYNFTFNNKGTFDYYCILHPFMTGKIVVSGDSNNYNPLMKEIPVSERVPKYPDFKIEKLSDHDNNKTIIFEIPKNWNSFMMTGNITSLNLDINAFISVNEYTSASFIIAKIPSYLGSVISDSTFKETVTLFPSILSPYSQYFTMKKVDSISFGENYSGTIYLVSINQDQINNMKSLIPLAFQKPLDIILISAKHDNKYYIIIFSTDFYSKKYDEYGNNESQMNLYIKTFSKILDSIRFSPDSFNITTSADGIQSRENNLNSNLEDILEITNTNSDKSS